MLRMLGRRFFMLIQIFVRIFKRALCCFRRRRFSSSNEPDSSPLTNINVISNQNSGDLQAWDEWTDPAKDSKLSPTEQQILLYRQEKNRPPPTEDETAEDYFMDMTPNIVKQKKILLASKKTDSTNHSFSLAPDPVFSSPELGVWDENQSWEAEADMELDVSGVVREQKRQERERRQLEQQRRKLERSRYPPQFRSS